MNPQDEDGSLSPVGLEVEIDFDAGTIRFLQAAVV